MTTTILLSCLGFILGVAIGFTTRVRKDREESSKYGEAESFWEYLNDVEKENYKNVKAPR